MNESLFILQDGPGVHVTRVGHRFEMSVVQILCTPDRNHKWHFVPHQDVSNFSVQVSKTPSTRIRIFLNPQLFLSGYGYRPHTSADIFESATFSSRIQLSSTRIRRIRKQIQKFLNPLSRVEIFESDNIVLDSKICGYLWTGAKFSSGQE